MKMIAKIENHRRGVAIELSLIILLLTTLFGLTLVSASVRMYERKARISYELTQQIELRLIAEDFINTIRTGGDGNAVNEWCGRIEGYVADVDVSESDAGRTVTLLISDADGNTVFILELHTADRVTYTVTKWDYTENLLA